MESGGEGAGYAIALDMRFHRVSDAPEYEYGNELCYEDGPMGFWVCECISARCGNLLHRKVLEQ